MRLTNRSWLLAAWAVLTLSAAALADVQTTFYVAPGGNDANPGTQSAPLATLDGARQAVRAVNRNMTGDVVVVLRGGVYRIGRTIVFGPEDSGTGGHNVIYRAATKETPVVSGGQPVAGWKPDEKGRWKAAVPLDNFRQLYVGGRRAVRARGAPPADLQLAGENGYKTAAAGMAEWRNPGDVEFCYLVSWTHTRCKVQGIARDGDRAMVTMLQPYFTHARTKEGSQAALPAYLENALELLDEPGEWYFDRPAKTLYYMPRPGEEMTKVEAIVPAVETLLELRGTLDRPAEHVRFEGITFRHGGWLRPSRIGHCDVQANFIFDSGRKDSFVREGFLNNLHNENLKSAANVVLHAAKSVRFERCTFSQLGGAGLDVESGSQDNVVSGCRFCDISGSAVQIGDVLKDDHHPDDPRKTVKGNTVENCYIHDCCVEYAGGVGVFAGYTQGTRVVHNEICRLPYSGISVGWGWGEEDAGGGAGPQPARYGAATPAKDNVVAMNHVHDVMQTMHDGGGIYTLGNMPNTVIRGNYLHDNRGEPGGIYLDEGSGFIEIAGNLVRHVAKPMVYNNLHQNRNATCREHDNFFGAEPEKARYVVEKAGLEADYQDL